MKKMTTAFMLLLISFGGLSQTVHANSALAELDANMLFGQSSHTVDVIALSEREMVETEGEFFIIGAIIGFLGYAAYNSISGADWDAGDAVSWSAAGATGGVSGLAAQTVAKGAVSRVIAPTAASGIGSGVGYGVSERIQNSSNNFGRDVSSYCPHCNANMYQR